jgi:hypothetical protein
MKKSQWLEPFDCEPSPEQAHAYEAHERLLCYCPERPEISWAVRCLLFNIVDDLAKLAGLPF